MLATLNPCGFVMLPAFVSYQLGVRETAFAETKFAERALGAARLSVAATAGFIAVFGTTGVVFALGGRALARFVPGAAIAIGLVLIGVGIAGLLGKTIALRLPTPTTTAYGPGLVPGFLFGIGYAVASLSCTLPIFLVVVGSALTGGGLMESFVPFIAYALGMGAVLGAVATATMFLKGAVVRTLVKATRHVERLGSLLLIAAGAYLVYYQLTTGLVLLRGF